MGKILRIKNLKKKNVWDSVESNEPLQGIISKKKEKEYRCCNTAKQNDVDIRESR
jgi:hypothetical protein